MHIVPLRFVFAVAVEHLDAMILPVGDIDPALFVGANVVDDVELPRIASRFAPRKKRLSVGRVFVHARIPITVGDVEIARRRKSHVSAAVKRLTALIGRRLARNTQGENNFSVQRALSYRMVAIIAQEDRFIGTHRGAMSPLEYALSP